MTIVARDPVPLRPPKQGALDHQRISVDGKFFARGTERFTFRGVTYGTFEPRAVDQQQFPSTDRLHQDLAAMVASGFTVVRTYVEPRGDVLDAIADSGLLTLAGTFWPDWRCLVGTSRRQQREMAAEARRLVRDAAQRMAGRTEVLGICLANEVPADVVRWVGTRVVTDLIADLAEEVRSVDANRLVTYANYPSTEYLPLHGLDFITFNIFLERKADLRRYLTRLHNLSGDLPLVLGEIGYGAGGASPAAEAAQADVINWQLETALERGVAGACVFSWTDEWWVGGSQVHDWHFGLTRSDRTARPALKVAEDWNRREPTALLPRSRWPSMSVVICAYNAAETLGECLAHTCRLDYPDLEIIVVDDGSTDDTAEIAARHSRARLVTIDHAGLSAARNEGMRVATGEMIAYLDADAYPSPEWPYFLALGFDSRSIAGVGGPNVPPRSDGGVARRIAAAPGGPVQVLVADDRAEHIPGCNMAFWRSVLIEVGGFDPVYTSAGDDIDICWKVLDRGWEIGFHPSALVWHHRRSSTHAYLRQQRGYGRAEALVAARHPDRFNSIGAARWRGRIYGAGLKASGRQRIYHGVFGTAAYQSIYRRVGTTSDVLHQLGMPVAALLLATWPLSLLLPLWWIAPIAAAAFAALLGTHDAMKAAPPHEISTNRGRFRLGVAWLSLSQPVVRSWGRLRAGRSARRDLPALSPLAGPAHRLPGGVVVVPAVTPREQIARTVVDILRRQRLAVTSPTGWEYRDVGILVSKLISADLLSSAHAEGFVQVQLRPRLRVGGWALAVIAAVFCWVLDKPFGVVALFGLALFDTVRGVWRARVELPRVLVQQAIGAS